MFLSSFLNLYKSKLSGLVHSFLNSQNIYVAELERDITEWRGDILAPENTHQRYT